MRSVVELHCMECRRVQPFEQPECVDTHGADCPEWVCIPCGSAVFAAVTPVDDTSAGAVAPMALRRSA